MKILSFTALREEKGIPYSKSHLWRLERDGKFPKRVSLGDKAYGWLDDEIDHWIISRARLRGNNLATKFTGLSATQRNDAQRLEPDNLQAAKA